VIADKRLLWGLTGLNRTLGRVSPVSLTRKPVDLLAERLTFKKGSGDGYRAFLLHPEDLARQLIRFRPTTWRHLGIATSKALSGGASWFIRKTALVPKWSFPKFSER
jgi:hypothetical protein